MSAHPVTQRIEVLRQVRALEEYRESLINLSLLIYDEDLEIRIEQLQDQIDDLLLSIGLER